MGGVSYIVLYGDNTAITKDIEVAHRFTLWLQEIGYDAKYERVEAEWN